MGHVWSGHAQSGLLLEWLCTIWCMFLIQTCARLLMQECVTAHLQAVMMIRFVVTKHPLQLGETLGKFFLEGREFASTESGNTSEQVN